MSNTGAIAVSVGNRGTLALDEIAFRAEEAEFWDKNPSRDEEVVKVGFFGTTIVGYLLLTDGAWKELRRAVKSAIEKSGRTYKEEPI